MEIDSSLLNLTSDIIVRILSDLPIETIKVCKSVCKKLFDLISSPEFVQFHLSRAKPTRVILLCIGNTCRRCKFYYFNDEFTLKEYEARYAPWPEFDLREFNLGEFACPYPSDMVLTGSVNGLICVRGLELENESDGFYILNPVTRESFTFIGPDQRINHNSGAVACGFGSSLVSDKYKVVRIVYNVSEEFIESECHVYTLGTGRWRSIAHDYSFNYDCRNGVLFNGNLHWFVIDIKRTVSISCLDLETEVFNLIPSPPNQRDEEFYRMVTVLGGRFCLCDNYSSSEIVIWVMKKYGVAGSWTKEYVIRVTKLWTKELVYSKIPEFTGSYNGPVLPVKVFENGDILMLWGDISFLHYSNKTKTPTMSEKRSRFHRLESIPHVSSFLSLRRFKTVYTPLSPRINLDSRLLSLPSNIITQILSNLPVKKIESCKFVCKKLNQLISSPEFVQFHLSMAKPTRVILQYVGNSSRRCKFDYYNDEFDLKEYDVRYAPGPEFDLRKFNLGKLVCPYPDDIVLIGSVDGLFCVMGLELEVEHDGFYILNPVIPESVTFLSPDQRIDRERGAVACGFGSSLVSGEYKVVRIAYVCVGIPEETECHVYTLGTGRWRSIAHDDLFDYDGRNGVLFNGNLHWFVINRKRSMYISCLDLETELFNPIMSPPEQRELPFHRIVTVLRDCLCLCDNYSDGEIVIWSMKEYGVVESWTKEFVIASKIPKFAGSFDGHVHPLKVFEDGDVLMLCGSDRCGYLIRYSNKNKTLAMEKKLGFYGREFRDLIPHVSSFLSLRRFKTEKIRSQRPVWHNVSVRVN